MKAMKSVQDDESWFMKQDKKSTWCGLYFAEDHQLHGWKGRRKND